MQGPGQSQEGCYSSVISLFKLCLLKIISSDELHAIPISYGDWVKSFHYIIKSRKLVLNFGNKNMEYRATHQHVSSSLAFLLVSMKAEGR